MCKKLQFIISIFCYAFFTHITLYGLRPMFQTKRLFGQINITKIKSCRLQKEKKKKQT